MSHSIPYPGLVKVSLAALRREDIPKLAEHANDMDVLEGVLLRPPVTLESEYEWYDGLSKRKAAGTDDVFAIVRHGGEGAEHEFIGITGMHNIMPLDLRASTGTLIFVKDALSKGCGTEAKLLLQRHAFRTKGLRKLTSSVKAFNARSLGHLMKCGYRICGRYAKQLQHDGRYVDEILLECFRDDWEPIWARYEETKELPRLTSEQRETIKKETGICRD